MIDPARIDNWRRYVLGLGIYYAQTASLEGHYRSPQVWHAQGPRPPDIDILDAQAMEAAWRVIRPLSSRQVVTWWHVYRLPTWTIGRRLTTIYGIERPDVEAEIERADRAFEEALGQCPTFLQKTVDNAFEAA